MQDNLGISGNRSDNLNLLDKRVKGFIDGYRQNIAVLGDDADELNYFLEDYLGGDCVSNFEIIHVLAKYGGKDEIYRNAVYSLLGRYLKMTNSMDQLVQSAVNLLPKTTGIIKETLLQNNISFNDILNFINSFILETKGKCLFVVEEFLALESVFPGCFKDFSKFIIVQRDCMVILTSSKIKKAENIMSEQLNLLFGNFELIHINNGIFFNNYMRLKKSLSVNNVSPFFISFLANYLGDNVSYYDYAVNCLNEFKRTDNEINDLASLMELLVYRKESYLFQRFMKRMDIICAKIKNYPTALKILHYISKGYTRKSDINNLNLCKPRDLETIISKFDDLGYLENAGNMCRIKDSLFSFWVSNVFVFYFVMPITNTLRRRIAWRHAVFENIDLFREDFFRDKVSKILGLMSSFDDDIIKCGAKNYILPKLTKNRVMNDPTEDNLSILIGEGREVVFAGIKDGNTDDNDIFNFIEKGKNLNGKKIKKIFISLSSIPSTAKVIAKDHNIMAWDIEEVNYLLKMYNHPVISFRDNFYSAGGGKV
ncbi:MAG: hypothetical protein PHP69_01010 [Candidatus Omnitrophica bacterium]|nr:hypothetical protein [Candidatus Omnitrophota bacterium]MDD5080988.1 hypothetical protein [Candidatus Omnitrophota bacterium]